MSETAKLDDGKSVEVPLLSSERKLIAIQPADSPSSASSGKSPFQVQVHYSAQINTVICSSLIEPAKDDQKVSESQPARVNFDLEQLEVDTVEPKMMLQILSALAGNN